MRGNVGAELFLQQDSFFGLKPTVDTSENTDEGAVEELEAESLEVLELVALLFNIVLFWISSRVGTGRNTEFFFLILCLFCSLFFCWYLIY